MGVSMSHPPSREEWAAHIFWKEQNQIQKAKNTRERRIAHARQKVLRQALPPDEAEAVVAYWAEPNFLESQHG